jgi:hypothetical protein
MFALGLSPRASEVDMAKGIDRLLIGGALAVGGLLHHRVGQVGLRVEQVEQSVQERAEQPPAPPAGMPLPTGYGLQVRGPVGEDILIPVCLPPGFELDSMVLRPAFLPDEQRRAAPVNVAPPIAPVPVGPVPAASPERDRLADALQLVYADTPGYTAQTEGVHAFDRPERERDLSVF